MAEFLEIMTPETSIAFEKGGDDGNYIELRIAPIDHPAIIVWYEKEYLVELAHSILTLAASGKAPAN